LHNCTQIQYIVLTVAIHTAHMQITGNPAIMSQYLTFITRISWHTPYLQTLCMALRERR